VRRRSLIQVLFVSAILVSSGLLSGCLMQADIVPAARPVSRGLPLAIPLPPPAPIVSLSAEPAAILQSDCATLAWVSTHASSLVISGGVGYVNLRGSRQVCPQHTTQYTLVARGPGGSAEASATITVTPLPAPTVSLWVHPTAILEGECAMLAWAGTHASSLVINAGIGRVDPEGSREVCPERTTRYTMAAQGRRDLREAWTVVTVTPPQDATVVDRLTLHIGFDPGTSSIRNADGAELRKALAFAARYPGYAKAVVGHTDSLGRDQDNQALSERRAGRVRAYLRQHGAADAGMIAVVGYGGSKPVADNATNDGRLKNQRIEILILSR